MKYLKWSIGIGLGAAAGFSYWYFIGCTSGSCAITSSPVNSSLYGGLMGALLLNLFPDRKTENENQKKSDRDNP